MASPGTVGPIYGMVLEPTTISAGDEPNPGPIPHLSSLKWKHNLTGDYQRRKELGLKTASSAG